MSLLARISLIIAALDGLLGVGIGAFAAHALKATATPEALALVSTGSTYQMIHGAAAVAVLWLAGQNRISAAAPFCLAAGGFLFAAALYGIGIFGFSLGMVAPIGGTLMLIGWGWLLVSAAFKAVR